MKHTNILNCIAALAVMISCEPAQEQEALKADFTVDTETALVGEVVTFTDVSTGAPTRWNWTFPGAETETSILTRPEIRWMEAGTYTITLKVANKNGEDEIVKSDLITINYHSSVTADFSFDKTQLFDSETISFTNLSKGFPNSIKWTFTPDNGSPVTSTEENPVMKLLPGVYSVKLEVSNPVAKDEKEVKDAFTVLDQYAVLSSFEAANATTYEGGSVKFTATSTGNVGGYQWTFEGGTPATSTEANPVVKYNSSGKFKVTLKTYNDKYENICEKADLISVLPDFNRSMVFLLPLDGNNKDFGPNGINPQQYSMGGYEPSFEAGHNGDQSFCMKFPGGTKGKTYSVILWTADEQLDKVYPQGSDMTLCMWFKIGAVSANNAFFAQGDCPGADPGGINNQIWARLQTGNVLRLTSEKTNSGSGKTLQPSNAKFTDGTWHHLAFTYYVGSDGKRTECIYLDGEQAIAPASFANLDTKTIPLCIGANLRLTNGAWAPENMFGGCMDDIVLYKSGLTAEQIKQLANL
ncbi:MAG: PKD domain-containing protein [Bacteroidales bacterium]|nr:PKD domain-containing protein [Bacteroidales bacterium]